MKILQILVFLLLLGSCGWKSNHDEPPLARAFEEYLYYSDLKDILPEDLTGEDSVRAVQKEIKKWLNTKALVQRARLNLPEEKQDFGALVEEYENSLFIYAYEKAIVDQKLNVEVSDAEIEAFYRENIEEFELKKPAIRINYARFDSVSFRLKQVRRLFNRDNPDSREELKEYCSQLARQSAIDDSTSWMYLDEVNKFLPLDDKKVKRIRSNKWASHFYHQGSAYICRMGDFLSEGKTAPLSLVRSNISERIIVRKRKELIQQLRFDLYNEGLNKKELEIFE